MEGSLPPAVSVLVQDKHSLVRACLVYVVNELEGAAVIGEASSHKEALEKSRKSRPDIILIDMDDQDEALALIREIRLDLPDSRVIGMTEAATEALIHSAIDAGASGLGLKSDSIEDLAKAFRMVRSGGMVIAADATDSLLRNYSEILRQKRERDAAIIETLASAVEAKDRYTGGHAHRVTGIATRITAKVDLALSNSDQLHYGFVLHDIGKIGIPEHILQKTSSLTTSEWTIMKTHPVMGVQIIAPLGFGEDCVGIVRHHHERWDGNGYPDRLDSNDIPLAARIFSIADTFDAMTTDRPYRQRMPIPDVVAEISAKAGSQFDPEIVDVFLEISELELSLQNQLSPDDEPLGGAALRVTGS